MTKQDLKKIGIIALITMVSASLPGMLYQRGLPLGWALALLGGFVAVALLARWV
jgi:hypothetical protein